MKVRLLRQLKTYSDPSRDKRRHTTATVFIGRAEGEPKGGDDAERAKLFTEETLPRPLVFDHAEILRDYFHYRKTGELPVYRTEKK